MLIPPGAPVIPIGTNVPNGTRNYALDIYDARGVPCLHLGADPQFSPDRKTRVEQIRERMPPAYWREPGRQAPRKGVAKWQIEAAFYRDLVGLGTAEIADDMDLRDQSTRDTENASRSARRYVERGRLQLVALGAWPWTLQPHMKGVLPPNWHRQERFASALAQWHFSATTEAIRDCLSAAEWAAGSRERGLTATVFDEAEDAYRRVYDAQHEPNEPRPPEAGLAAT